MVSIALPPDLAGGTALQRSSRRLVCIIVAARSSACRAFVPAVFRMRALTLNFYIFPQLLYPPDELLALSADLRNVSHPDGFPTSSAQPSQRVLPRLLQLPQSYGRLHPRTVVPYVSHCLGRDAVLHGQASGVGGKPSVSLDLVNRARIFSGECRTCEGRLAGTQFINLGGGERKG